MGLPRAAHKAVGLGSVYDWSVEVHNPLRAPLGCVCGDFGAFAGAFGVKFGIRRPESSDLVRDCGVFPNYPNTPWILGLFGTVEL